MSKSQTLRLFYMVFKFLYMILREIQPKGTSYAQELVKEADNLMDEIRGI